MSTGGPPHLVPAAFDFVCPSCGWDIHADDPIFFIRVMPSRLEWPMCQPCGIGYMAQVPGPFEDASDHYPPVGG